MKTDDQELWEEIAMRVAVAVVSRGVASEVIHGGTTTVLSLIHI